MLRRETTGKGRVNIACFAEAFFGAGRGLNMATFYIHLSAMRRQACLPNPRLTRRHSRRKRSRPPSLEPQRPHTETILLWLGGEPKNPNLRPENLHGLLPLSFGNKKYSSKFYTPPPSTSPSAFLTSSTFNTRKPSSSAAACSSFGEPLRCAVVDALSQYLMEIMLTRAQTATRATRRRRCDRRCFVSRQESRLPNPVTATPVAIRHLKKKGKIQSAKTKHLKPFALF